MNKHEIQVARNKMLARFFDPRFATVATAVARGSSRPDLRRVPADRYSADEQARIYFSAEPSVALVGKADLFTSGGWWLDEGGGEGRGVEGTDEYHAAWLLVPSIGDDVLGIAASLGRRRAMLVRDKQTAHHCCCAVLVGEYTGRALRWEDAVAVLEGVGCRVVRLSEVEERIDALAPRLSEDGDLRCSAEAAQHK